MSSTQRVERTTRKTGIPAPDFSEKLTGQSSGGPQDSTDEPQAPEPTSAPDPQAARDRAQRILHLEHALEGAARQPAGLPLPAAQVQGFLELLVAANTLPDERRAPLLDRLERFGTDLLASVSRRPADVTLLHARLYRLWIDAGAAAEAAGK